MITKEEMKYMAFAFLFGIVYFILALPLFLKWGAESLNPYIQFLLFNAGIFIFLQIFLKELVLKTKSRFRISTGIFLLFIALDLLAPPFAVGIDGSLLGTGTSSLVLVQSSSDYMFGYLFTQIGISGFLVFLFTYIIMPFLLLFLASLLIPNAIKEI